LRSSPSDDRAPRALPPELADALGRVRPRLGRLGGRSQFFDTIGSTNDAAAALATEGAVVVADRQTAGRGRRGRSWFSPPGSGLYVSVVLMPRSARVDPDRATAVLTLAAGVALVEGVERATGLRADLKWPNDLYVQRRKLGGILAEADMPAVTLGYGINVGPMAYPPELSDRATSLEAELGRPIDRALVFAETLAALAARYDDLLDGRIDAILDAWRSRAPGYRGALVSWTAGGDRTGTTAGIDEYGALLVRTEGRVERIVAGELKWL
jgi:BirA family transcriptional regulator, biotin operon repressor / biotin---[acetyl-CoA-carboxylase] ligase